MQHLIDLSQYREPLHGCLADAVTRFNDEPTQPQAYTVALAVFPYHPACYFAIDTRDAAEKRIARLKDEGLDWYVTDKRGEYHQSPADFAYPEYGTLQLDDFPNLDEVDGPLTISDPFGAIHTIDIDEEGDEALNRVMLPTWIGFLKDFSQWQRLRKDEPLRIGVVMHDSPSVSFFAYDAA